MFAHFKSIAEITKKLRVYMVRIRDVCIDFEPCFKVCNLVSVHPKKNQTWSNDYSRRDLSCGGVSLSID